jgi:phosphate starvation-inducible PhoH-like protein
LSELIINLETVDPVDFFGVNNTNLRILKQSFNKLKILARGDKIMVAGAPEDLDEFQLKVDEIFKFFNRHGKLSKDQLEEILNNAPLPAVETADLLDDVLDDVLVAPADDWLKLKPRIRKKW